MSKIAVRDYRGMIDGPPGSKERAAKKRAYMESNAFQPLRDAVERRSGGICERLDESGQIRCENDGEQIHHLDPTYVCLFRERPSDLQHLCKECHAFVHGYSDSQVDPLVAYRPKDLSLEVPEARFIDFADVKEIGVIENHGHVYVPDGSRLCASGDNWLPSVSMFHDCPIGTIGKHRYKLAVQDEHGEPLITMEWFNDAAFSCKAAIEQSEALFMWLRYDDMSELFLGFGSLCDAEDWLYNFQGMNRPGFHKSAVFTPKPTRHPRLQCRGKVPDIDLKWVSRCFGGDFWWNGHCGSYARIWRRLWEHGS